jgi:DNA (cytosine-5)-methyltransferase 1
LSPIKIIFQQSKTKRQHKIYQKTSTNLNEVFHQQKINLIASLTYFDTIKDVKDVNAMDTMVCEENNKCNFSMNKSVTCIDFFAGIGAWEVAASLVSDESMNLKTIEFIEINEKAKTVLRSHYPDIPIHSDIKTYQPTKGEVDVYFISFPCTGTSCGGHRTGLAHPESSLWWEALRCIIFGRPDFIIIENPSGLEHRGLREVVGSLHLAGYQTELEMFTIAMFGAPHKRERIFIIAYTHNLREQRLFRSWSDNVRDDIERTRTIITRSQTQSQICSLVNGISPELSGLHFDGWWKMNQPPEIGVEKGLRNRREAVSLVGRSIALPQSICALLRLKFLFNLGEEV